MQAFALAFYSLPPGSPADCAAVVAPFGKCTRARACCTAGFACTDAADSNGNGKQRCLPAPSLPSPEPPSSPSPAASPEIEASPSPSPEVKDSPPPEVNISPSPEVKDSPAPEASPPPPASPLPPPASPSPPPTSSGNNDGTEDGGDDQPEVDLTPAVIVQRAVYEMPRPANAGKAASAATVTTVLLRARTPDGLRPEASRVTLTLSGRWQPGAGVDPEVRSGKVVIQMPPGPYGVARPALAATKASHFADADSGAADFSYSVAWHNLTALPAGEALAVVAQTRGGAFKALSVTLEIQWQEAPNGGDGTRPPTAPVVLPPGGAGGGDGAPAESTMVVSTDGKIRFDPSALAGASPAGGLGFFALLNFTVPPAFDPAANRVELWTRGEWVADASSGAAPLGVVGVAHNGTLLAYAVPSHFASHAGASANFSFGTAFANVTLPPGARAEIWAGMRGGRFRALAASATLTWSDGGASPAAVTVAEAAGTPPSSQQQDPAAAEQTASVSAPARTVSSPSKAAPVLNFTAPRSFNPEANQVEMWLAGSWENATSGGSGGSGGGANGSAPAPAPPVPVGGVALVRNGQVLAYTSPSAQLARGGRFFYGAVWQNVGLPADGGVVEVWAGLKGGTFKGLNVNITLKWTPGEHAAGAEPLAEAVTGNPLEGAGPLVVQHLPSPAPAPEQQSLRAAEAADAPGAAALPGSVGALLEQGGSSAAACTKTLAPWDQCGERRAL